MISQDPVAFVGCSSNRHQLADSLKLLHRLKIDTLIVNREVNADSIRNSWPTLDPSLTLIYPQLMGAQTAERSSPNDFYLSWIDLPYEEVIGMLLKEITKVGNRQGFFLFHTTDRDVVKDEFTKQWEGKYMLSIDPNSIFANNLNERPFESIYEKYKDSIEAVAGDIFIIDFEGTLNEGQLKDLVEGFNRTSSQRIHIIAHQHNEVYLSRTLCRDDTKCILWSISPSFDQTIGDDRLEWPNRVQDFEDFIAEPYRYTKIFLDMTMSENTSLFTITKLYGMSSYYHPTLTFTFDALILSWFASVAKGYGMDGILNSFDGTIVNDRAFSFGILRELANEIAISTNASNILNGVSGPISFEDGFRTQPILARCIYNQAVLEQSLDLTQLSQSEDFQSFIQECNALVMQ